MNWIDLWGLDANTIALGLKAVAGVGFASPDPVTTAVAIFITGFLVVDYLSGGKITQGIADFIGSIISPSVPIRDRERNPIPIGNQSPVPQGKGANADAEDIGNPGDLGGNGFKPPEPNDPYSRVAAAVIIGAPRNTIPNVPTFPTAPWPEPNSSTASMTNNSTQSLKTK